ncbi:hypothetical protein H5410_013830 [Solanum commersonii]|uniref:Sugar transporter n=1 Tax=Solanum commersonii TaxID=4109 RepID=A0A9J5ZPA6_SOLCO|nr:hypothetical protein H5410_013830 [Solanum commersonii]
MAGGGGGISHGNNGKEYPGNLTLYVTMTCIVAAMGGLIFGYDIGISGSVDLEYNMNSQNIEL